MEDSIETLEDEAVDRSRELRSALEQVALAPQAEKLYPDHRSLFDPHPELVRWPSGLGPRFDSIFGGLQGVTVLGGAPGVGKSTWAMACALENAMDGALVLYFDSENSSGTQHKRMIRWFGGESAAHSAYPRVALGFRWYQIDERHSWQTILLRAAKEVAHRHSRVLMVFDSMQSVADEIDGRRNMLQVTAELYRKMNRITCATHGRVAFLVLSELNKEGGMKGGAGSYRGTMLLRISREESMAGADADYRIEMLKNRDGRYGGDLGIYMLDWSRCRFREVETQ